MSRVLYVNQTGAMSGAEHSLLGLLAGLPRETIAGVACPEGGLVEAIRRLELPRWELIGTDVSFRLHPRHTVTGLARVVEDARRLRTIVRLARPDIVHANTTRAGLAATLAGLAGGPPIVVHIRDWLPASSLAQLTLRMVQSRSAAVIANSAHVRDQLPVLSRGAAVHVVHNAVDTVRFNPASIDRLEARRRFGLNPADPVLTVVGQLTPWKGQIDAVRVASILRRRFPRLRLLVVGSAKFTDAGTRFDNQAFDRELRSLIEGLRLEHTVVLAGERDDIPHVLRATDVLLVPSWQEAFGRVALEGMAMGVPVVATNNGGPAEFVRDGEDGRVLEPQRPHLWAGVVGNLIDDVDLRARMGANGQRRATDEFGIAGHADQVTAVYDQVRR